MNNAQNKQDNQDKLYYDSLKQDVDDELDNFPIMDDSDPNANQTIKLDDNSIKRAKN